MRPRHATSAAAAAAGAPAAPPRSNPGLSAPSPSLTPAAALDVPAAALDVPFAASASPGPRAPILSEKLFAGATEVQIAHRGSVYRLKQTALGKLILTK